MEEDVFDYVAGDSGMVEDSADDDGVVGGVVVAEAVAGVVAAPGELGASHESAEEAAVQVFENFFEMIVVAAGGVDVLASAELTDETRFGGDVVAGDVSTVGGGLRAFDRLAVELGEQDVRDRVEHPVGRGFEQVGEADVKFSLAQADGVVDGDERVEADVECGNGRNGPQDAVGGVEDLLEL